LGPRGPQILMAEQAIVVLASAFVAVRLFLSWPASGLSGHIAVLRTWPLTRGSFWRIFVSYAVVQLPMMLTVILLGLVLGGQLAAFTPPQTFGFALLSGLLAGAASTPLNAALQAYFYRALGPAPDGGPDGTGRA
jgi:hypothetical protein